MIKFVYFDVGGVAILDFSGTDKWAEMKRIMGVKKSFSKGFDELFKKYEREELCLTRNVDSLIPIFSKRFGMKFPENFSMLSYFVQHFDKNLSLWPVVEKIHESCGVGLLTNMYVDMLSLISKSKLLPPVKWDAVVDSSKVNVQKPDVNIFRLAEKMSGFQGSEILFVENNVKNVEAAKKYGWKTFLYSPENAADSSRRLFKYTREKLAD